MALHPLLEKLTGGDRRSIGRADEVAAEVLAEPSLFAVLIDGMHADDPLIRMRAADAAEKVSAKHPEWLQPHKKTLIEQIAPISQQEVRWHAAQMFPRLQVSPAEQTAIVEILLGYLSDKSKIVQTFSLQALADFAERDADLRPQVVSILREMVNSKSAAVRSRSQKLLQKLGAEM